MQSTLRNLYGAFVGLPMPAQVIITVAAIVAVLVGLALSVVLSPLLAVLFLLAFLASVAVFLYRLFRSRPVLWWGVAGAAFFVLMLAFSGVSAALYGGGGGEGQGGTQREAAERRPAPRAETTQARPETMAEITAEEETTSEQAASEKTARAAPSPEPEPPPDPEPEPRPEKDRYDSTVTVTRVVDGDTIEIQPAVEGANEVRLIGVDTPETKDPREEVEPYGPEASAFAISELEGREVGIDLDAEKTDRYGRLLAYVYVGDEMFNKTLVNEGYAQTWIIEPNSRHEGALSSAQESARGTIAGIWGLPLSDQCLLANHGNGIGEGTPGCVEEQEPEPAEPQYDPEPSANPAPNPSPRPNPAPGGDVDCSDFGSSAEAQPYLQPGDPYGLDADGDGQACDSLQ